MSKNVSFMIGSFPMGPNTRKWMSVDEQSYRGHENSSPSPDQIASFTDAFLRQLEEKSPKNRDHLVDLIEELVAMNLPLLAIKLVDAYPNLFPADDFRAQLNLGNAAMLVSDLARAEAAFIDAQKLVPEEPAPYVNLAQIYCHDGLLTQAENWCLAGLDADSDNTRLWELMAWLEQQKVGEGSEARGKVIKRIRELARSKNSWAGLSLACELEKPEDPLSKVLALESFWNEGCRDDSFLIEYTATLGMAGHYDKIPAIIWQAEKQSENKKLAWQLYLHLVQAHMGLGRDDDAREALIKLEKRDDLPKPAADAIGALKSELAQ